MNDYKFGNFLYMLREKKGMTQADVATKLGVTPAAVSKWENGSSKPRVEVLFQLAQLLGVRTEELMCGEYIYDETLDPEAVKRINERYNYLIKVDSCNSAKNKWRRILAWMIDWLFFGTVFMILVPIAAMVLQAETEFNMGASPAAPLIFPIAFIFRDVVFGGRSLGKRILGLVVLNRRSGTAAGLGKCFLRNLFLLIIHIDFIVMLVSGVSIGDRVAQTMVVRKDIADNNINNIAEINKYSAPKKTGAKKVVLIIGGILIIFFAVIFLSLSISKNTKEYKVAYDYFITSETFEQLGAEESEIWYNGYSVTTHTNDNIHNATHTAVITLTVKGKSYGVVCHKQNDVWAVCEECTGFK